MFLSSHYHQKTISKYQTFLESNFAGVNSLFASIYLTQNYSVKRFNAKKLLFTKRH